MINKFFLSLLTFVLFPQISYAYIGPGIALGTIALIIVIVGILLLTILAILYYPIKKMLKNIKLKKNKKDL